MSRNKQKNPNATRTCTVYFDEGFALALDEMMIGLGLENRSMALMMLARAGMSTMPLDSALGTAMQQVITSTKRAEFEALAVHFEQRAKIYRDAAS